MNKKKLLSEIENEIEKLKEEKEKSEVFLEKNKKNFSNELIKFNKDQIKNTIHIETNERLTLWKRIKQALGII
jgi:hypothetical protein